LRMALEPDPRWRNILGGLTPSGEGQPMSVEVLEELASDWATIVERVESFGGTELLAKARALVVQSWFDYELLVTACLSAFQAVEATFRQVLFPDAHERVPFRHLVDRAERERLFAPDKADILRSGVELRNSLSHPAGRMAFTLGMADSILRVSHLVVRDACAVRQMGQDTGSPASRWDGP